MTQTSRLFLLSCLLLGEAAHAAPAVAEREIRLLRARSNAAIAAHDFAAMRTVYLPDFTILPGSSGSPSSVEQLGERLTAAFADPSFVTYVRTPTAVTVGASGKRAAEVGTWVGTWRKPDGEMRLSGVYQAMWLPTGEGWRLKNESFVSLECQGSNACAEVD